MITVSLEKKGGVWRRRVSNRILILRNCVNITDEIFLTNKEEKGVISISALVANIVGKERQREKRTCSDFLCFLLI